MEGRWLDAGHPLQPGTAPFCGPLVSSGGGAGEKSCRPAVQRCRLSGPTRSLCRQEHVRVNPTHTVGPRILRIVGARSRKIGKPEGLPSCRSAV